MKVYEISFLLFLTIVYIFSPIFPLWIQWLAIAAGIFIICLWFHKKECISRCVLITLFLLFVVAMTMEPYRTVFERFENETTKEEYLPNPELKKVTLTEGKDWTQTLVKLPPTLRDVLRETLEKEQTKSYNKDKIQEKDPKDMSPAEAQRSTYYLIDTMKQLNSTLEHMKPVLEQGKELMENLKMMPSLE